MTNEVPEDIKKAMLRINPKETFSQREDWILLFRFYNQNIKDDGKTPLTLSCRPCYAKVYLAITKQMINEGIT